MKSILLRIVSLILFVFIFFYLIPSKSVVFGVDCYCAGTYCFGGCTFCSAGSQYSHIHLSGETGGCTGSSTCGYGNAGGMAGCSPTGWYISIGCSSCTGGYFDMDYPWSVTSDKCLSYDACSSGGGTCNCGTQECASGCSCCFTGCKKNSDCSSSNGDSACIVRTCRDDGGSLKVNCAHLTIDGTRVDPSVPVTLNRYQTYSFGATYWTSLGQCREDQECSMGIVYNPSTACNTPAEQENRHSIGLVQKQSGSVNNTTLIFAWAPGQIGTYKIYCTSSKHAVNSCSGTCNVVDWHDDLCNGPDAYGTINVVEPPPSTSTVQGCKILGTSGDCYAAANSPFNSTTVTLDGTAATQLGNSALNSYSFSNVSAGPHEVAIPSAPSGYSVSGYSLCPPNQTCLHTSLTGTSNSVYVNVPAGGYVDLWWHFTLGPPPPGSAWWQVKDSDVRAGGNLGNLISLIPNSCVLPSCNPVFGLKGAGGYPGVPLYGGLVADFRFDPNSTGQAAEGPNNWLANTDYAGQTYDYDYFARQIPSDVVPNIYEINSPSINGGDFNSNGNRSRGYIWFHYNGATLGDLTVSGNVNINTDRKVVLLVEGADLHLDGRINIQNPGSGFFMAIVGKRSNPPLKGNIFISSTHPNQPVLEGIYLAEGTIHTTSQTGAGADKLLYVRGSYIGLGGVELERSLTGPIDNSHTPAETFEYAPELMLVFPQIFSTRTMHWKEVAP